MDLTSFRRFKVNDDIDSYDDLGLIITKMPPVPAPSRSIETIQVTGSNKSLHIDHGNYLPINYTLNAIVKDITKLDLLKSKLKSFGKIELSILPGRYYDFCNKNQIDFSIYANAGLEFPLQLELQPLAYSNEESLTFSESSTFVIDGTEKCNPIICIEGKGTVTINNISIKTLEDDITIDCELMESSRNYLSKNDQVVCDEFPFLLPGENHISFDDSINSVQIKYCSRWS